MAFGYPVDEISFNPLKKDIQNYSWNAFRADLSAGITVALLSLPQAMAYALLAGLPISCGIFSAIYGSIVAALCGSSRQLVTGPSNTLAILIQSGTSLLLYTYYRDLTTGERDIVALQILTQLTFLVALLQILVAWSKLGRLTQFVSHSVVVAYMTGTALAVIISQLFIFTGITKPSGVHSLYENATYLISHLFEMQWMTTLMGCVSLALLIVFKKLHPRFPAAIFVFAIAGVTVHFLGLTSFSESSWFSSLNFFHNFSSPHVMVIGDTGELSQVIPQLSFPFFNMRIINGILPIACAIALLSIIDTTSVAKSIAANTGQRLSLNQEIFGIGIGNLICAFFGAMPVSGNPSRSSLNYQSGAETRFSVVINAIFVFMFVVVLSYFVTRIPMTTLAALVLFTAASFINTKQLLFCIRTTQSDAFVLWTTLLACIFFSLDLAFYIGVTLSIVLYLKSSAAPQLVEYTIDENGAVRQLEHAEIKHHQPIRMIKIEGELFFGAADLFQKTLKTFAEDDTSIRVIILQLKNARDIDATSCFALKQLHDYLRSSNRYLIACGMTHQVWEVFINSGLLETIGKENLFVFDEKHPHEHMQKALTHAEFLVAQIAFKSETEATEPVFTTV